MTSAGLGMVKMFEQYRAEVYLDAVGKPTVGYGHLVRPGEVFDHPLTQEEALELLRKDVDEHEAETLALVKVPIQPHEQDALVSFVFNTGATAFETSTMLKMLNDGKPRADVADQFTRWVYGTKDGKKVRLPGLVKRRNVEAALFLGAGRDLVRSIYLGV